MIRDYDIWHHRNLMESPSNSYGADHWVFEHCRTGGKELQWHSNKDMYTGYRIVGFEAELDVERKRFDVSFYYGFIWM